MQDKLHTTSVSVVSNTADVLVPRRDLAEPLAVKPAKDQHDDLVLSQSVVDCLPSSCETLDHLRVRVFQHTHRIRSGALLE